MQGVSAVLLEPTDLSLQTVRGLTDLQILSDAPIASLIHFFRVSRNTNTDRHTYTLQSIRSDRNEDSADLLAASPNSPAAADLP